MMIKQMALKIHEIHQSAAMATCKYDDITNVK